MLPRFQVSPAWAEAPRAAPLAVVEIPAPKTSWSALPVRAQDTTVRKATAFAATTEGQPTDRHKTDAEEHGSTSTPHNCAPCDAVRAPDSWCTFSVNSSLEGRPLVEILVEVALVQVNIPHDHDVGRVAEDATQPLDLAAVA